MATNNSGPFSQSKPFTEAIRSRIEALDPGRPESGSAVCNECGSPLSEASQFCWMCGATRSTERDPRVDFTSGPVLLKSDPAASIKPISPPVTSIRPPVNGTAALAYVKVPAPEAPQPELVQQPEPAIQASEPPLQPTPPAPEEKFFEPDFRPKLADAFSDEQQPENKKFSVVRAIVAAVLLVIVAGLGYWQRNNFRITFGMLKAAIAEQWKGDEESQRMPPYTNPSATTHARKRLRATPAPSARPEVSPSATASFSPRRLPLGISVRGQQSQGPSLLTASDGIVHNGAVQVGISDALITTAKLSPMAVEISPRESLALLIRRVPPQYPEQARKLGTQGSVVLKVVIRKDGNVGDVRAITGDQLLVPAAIDAVRQWMYKPYYRDGVPTEVETFVTVEFSLASPVSPAN